MISMDNTTLIFRYYEHVGKVYRVLGKPHKAEDCLLRAEFIMNHVLEEGSHESLGVTVSQNCGYMIFLGNTFLYVRGAVRLLSY